MLNSFFVPKPPSEKAIANRRLLPLLLLALLGVLYCILTMRFGRFAASDEVFFKAAGRYWAATGHFAAPELVGRLSEGPPLTEIYFAQPPLYTFLFGPYVKVAGFSAVSCISYDMIIHLLLMWCAVLFARTVYGLGWNWAALCGALLLTIGTVGRPDELGIVFAMLAATAFRSQLPKRLGVSLGGALLGLCICTSLGAFLFLGPLALLELFWTQHNFAGRMGNCGWATVSCLAVVVFCVFPILRAHPAAYKQMIEHTGEQSILLSALTGEARNSSLGLIASWAIAFKYGYAYFFWIGGMLLFSALCWCLDGHKPEQRIIYWRVGLLFASLAGIFLIVPGKYPYLLFQGCWLLIACVALAARLADSLPSWHWRLLLAFGCGVWLLASWPAARWTWILWQLPEDQSLRASTERVRAEVPPGVGVMTTDYWWDLADRDNVYDLVFSDPGIQSVDYIVLSGNGSGEPGVPADFRAKYKPGFAPVSDHLNRERPHIGGIYLSRSAYGFGAYILHKASGGLN